MKVFVFLVICIVAVAGKSSKLQSNEFDKKIKEYRRECILELKLDPGLITGKDGTTPSPQEETCFQACLDKKFGMMNEDGTYNLERMMVVAGTPEARKQVEKVYYKRIKSCQAEVGNDPCKMAGCAHNMPKHFWTSKE